MAEREVVLDPPVLIDEQAEALRQATERAERAEAELAKLKQAAAHAPVAIGGALKTPPTPSTKENAPEFQDRQQAEEQGIPEGGEAELRKDSMMAHLLDSLAAGKDIGHYGRLVFAMVARHFLSHDEVLAWMMKDRGVDEDKARLMVRQVEGRDYNPPRREKILAYQAQQEFPILPFPDDPDCGNLYRTLKFPDEVYEHIGHYQEAKMESEV
jgi:hypothetical protein